MADGAEDDGAKPKRRGKAGWLIAGLLAVLAGAGGFYATWSGLLFGASGAHEAEVSALPDIGFVPIDPVVISLPDSARSTHLRFTAQLEVTGGQVGDVTLLLPRIVDVLNGYLRAIDVAELEDPTALVRIRAQLLRRVQLVAGEGRVRDLLVTEFVLN